jgi:hypothetical protein
VSFEFIWIICNLPENRKPHFQSRENFKSHKNFALGDIEPIAHGYNIIWNVSSCNLVDVYRYLGGKCCLHLQGR